MLKNNFLETIKEMTLQRVNVAKQELAPSYLNDLIGQSQAPLPFVEKLMMTKGIRIIAEVKRQSPSRGDIALHLDPLDVAKMYAESGAAAISVLTEPKYFGGSIESLRMIRLLLPGTPLLMKDFILEPFQLLQARAAGADAVLLMYSLLEKNQLHEMYEQAILLGLTPLLEVHDEIEMQAAVDLRADLVGINNRNLKTLEVSLDNSRGLAPMRSAGMTLIAESGIQSPSEICELSQIGFDGFLIGTALTAHGDPAANLKTILRACHGN